ncbi:hypothetical protein TSOC_000555 [Tetrabaena socialis]|uniref:Uncharacterized protein n=1 Tax=Tetrabaena socialis TaxID=47790 RepID=A0A2J8AIY3_9CHLO|nr:hypothetical protein TSOC_000555 [Tetrabaena socialis]|eukprot:PNH12475.1 hypothetical protein TSOC_000555 [Tetrabaena socialis]
MCCPHDTSSSTPEQRQQIPALLALLRQPGAAAQRLAGLTALAASYRDLSLALTSLHLREQNFDLPLLVTDAEYGREMAVRAKLAARAAARADNAGASPAADAAAPAHAHAHAREARRGCFVPLVDVTEIDDGLQVDGKTPAPEEVRLDVRHMDKISCWAATQPNHLEVSHQLLSSIKLFPPTEASYPTYVDFDAATRLLSHHTSRKRLRLTRRLLRKQDKYQLQAWDHHPGEA